MMVAGYGVTSVPAKVKRPHRCSAVQGIALERKRRQRDGTRYLPPILSGLQIADALSTCERTVKAHRARVLRKMGVQSAAELGRAVEWLGQAFQTAPSG